MKGYDTFEGSEAENEERMNARYLERQFPEHGFVTHRIVDYSWTWP